MICKTITIKMLKTQCQDVHTDYSSLNVIVSINKLKTSSFVIITAKIIEISEGKLVEIYDQTSFPKQTNLTT